MSPSLTTPRGAENGRWGVHVVLMVSFVASLLVLATTRSLSAHVIVGVVFLIALVVHLRQRRH